MQTSLIFIMSAKTSSCSVWENSAVGVTKSTLSLALKKKAHQEVQHLSVFDKTATIKIKNQRQLLLESSSQSDCQEPLKFCFSEHKKLLQLQTFKTWPALNWSNTETTPCHQTESSSPGVIAKYQVVHERETNCAPKENVSSLEPNSSSNNLKIVMLTG